MPEAQAALRSEPSSLPQTSPAAVSAACGRWRPRWWRACCWPACRHSASGAANSARAAMAVRAAPPASTCALEHGRTRRRAAGVGQENLRSGRRGEHACAPRSRRLALLAREEFVARGPPGPSIDRGFRLLGGRGVLVCANGVERDVDDAHAAALEDKKLPRLVRVTSRMRMH